MGKRANGRAGRRFTAPASAARDYVIDAPAAYSLAHNSLHVAGCGGGHAVCARRSGAAVHARAPPMSARGESR